VPLVEIVVLGGCCAAGTELRMVAKAKRDDKKV
jgi:hypothetical protein